MGTLLFIVGIIVAVAVSLYGWIKIISTIVSKDKKQKDIVICVAWVIVFAAGALLFWFTTVGLLAGYLTGLVLSFAVCMTVYKPEEAKAEEKEGQ